MSVLGDVLEPAGVPERVADPARERFVTVRLNCGGAVERSIGAGKTPVPFTGYRVRHGQFIYSRIDARNGAFAVIPAELDGAVVSKDFPVFDIRSDRITDRYLTHFFASGRLERAIRARSRGATNRQRIKEDEFLGFPIELPALPEQRRIAAILDHADALRAKRRQVLTHLDTLAQSIFHEMFDAHPDTVRELAEVADFYGGASLPPSREFQGQPGGTLLMKVSDMNSPGNETHIGAATLWTDGPTPRSSTVGPGAIVLPKRGAAIATNKKRIITRRTALDPNLMGVQPKPEALTTSYLYAWFKSFDLATITSGSTVPQLNKQDLAPLPIPVPSLARQEEFGSRMAKVAALRRRCESAGEADHRLFDALQSRAFRGEL